MNRKNWVSALLAVMMVLSMTAMIILPSGAAATLNEQELAALPLASTATKADGKTAYKIDSVSELLAASHNAITNSANSNSSNNFETGETIYLTADLDINDWDYSRFATYDEETGKYTTIGRMGVSTGNYRKYDPTAAGIVCDSLAEVFATLYNGFNARNARYTYFYPNLDGLNHTIYNFYAYNPLVGGCATGDATISNLTMVNAKVDTTKQDSTLWTGTYAALLVGAADVNGGINFNNVHVRDSHLYTGSASNVGMFVAFANNGNATQRRDIDIINCSVINSVVESVAENTAAASLMVGAADHHVTIQNSLLMNSIVKVNAASADYGSSFIANNRYGNTVIATYKDIAVVDCQFQTKETTASNFAIALNFNAKTKSTTTIDGLYATGNTWATIDNNGAVVGNATPLTILVRDKANLLGGGAEGLTWGTNYKVDQNVEYLRYEVNAAAGYLRPSIPVAAENIIEPLTATKVMNLLNGLTGDGYGMWAWTNDMSLITTDNPNAGPKDITFTFANLDVVTYMTDYEGKLIASASDRIQLQLREWDAAVGRDVGVGTAWSEMTFDADASYTEIPHDFTIVEGDNNTHTISCNSCDELIHNQTVPCVEYAPDSYFVMGDYFHPSVYAYECICGRIWTEIDDISTATIKTPLTLKLDKAAYSNVDVAVAVTLGVKQNTNLNAMTVELEYDPAVLAPVGMDVLNPNYACVSNDAEAANGKLILAIPHTTGGVLSGDVVTVHFGFTSNADVNVPNNSFTVNATMTGAIVYDDVNGTQDLSHQIVVPNVSVMADTFYVETNVIPGDVNGDYNVELLDAVLILAKLNNNITAEQNDAFLLMAADVNNDGVMNVIDSNMIMQYVADLPVTLLPCDTIPTFTLLA